MSAVYLINVGANSSHGGVARSPIFDNGSFVYVSFPTDSVNRTQAYSGLALPFVRNPGACRTHADPDWAQLTYGDYCANPRAGALKRVEPEDILLFWGLLWSNQGSDWSGFTGERDWYLLGALRVEEVLRGGHPVSSLSQTAQARAALNAHLEGDDRLREDHRVFVGDLNRSRLFSRAISLGVSVPDGLIYRAFTAASGNALSFSRTPPWQSSLRSCRKMWNLEAAEDRARAELVREAISARNDFDLLAGP